MRTRDFLLEVNWPEELDISEAIQQYFISRGYELIGEGREQMAFLSPRHTVVKVLGIGDEEREQIVKDYVAFFLQHQDNPYYPKIYNTGNFTLGDETYFVYEMEYLPNYIANQEQDLDYLEKLIRAIEQKRVKEFLKTNPVPAGLDPKELKGLVEATVELEKHLGGQAPLDIGNLENLARRADKHIVILDPYSL